MTLFRPTYGRVVQINSWIERSSYRGKLVSHVTFGSADPETWSVVSCRAGGDLGGCDRSSVSSARLPDQSSRKVGVRPLLTGYGIRQRKSLAAVTDH